MFLENIILLEREAFLCENGFCISIVCIRYGKEIIMKKKFCIVFFALVVLGGVMVSVTGISKAKVEKQPAQTKSAPLKLEGASERQEFQNGVIIESEVWSREIDEASESELKSELEERSDGQAGTPAK